MLKIVYLLNSMSGYNGVRRIITNKANALAEKDGYDISVVVLYQSDSPDAYPLSDKVKVYRLDIPFYPALSHFVKARRMRQSIVCELDKLFEKIRPDVMIGTDEWYIPALTDIHYPCVKIWEAHRSRKNYTESQNYSDNPFLSFFISLKKKQQMRQVERKCDFAICLTKGDAALYRHAKNVRVIPNFTSIKSEGRPRLDSKHCISAGRLEFVKGFDRLIDTWKLVHERHSDWVLDIYGEGSERDMLDRMIDLYGMQESVIIHEPVTDIQKQYRDSAFYVAPSRSEGFGLTLIEANTCALPVVTFDFDFGSRDIVDNGVSGIIVPDGDVEALANGICELIEDPEKLRRYSEAALEKSKMYSEKNIIERWVDFFEEIKQTKVQR